MRLRFLLPAAALAIVLAPDAASAAFLHTVMPGESLTSIAAADGLTVAELAAANGISSDTQLLVGSTVAIPAQGAPVVPAAGSSPGSQVATGDGDGDGDDQGDEGSAASAAAAAPATAPATGSYVVQPGDTLTAIAARAGVSVADLAAANNIDPAGVLLAGSVLVMPGQGPAASAPAQPPAVGATYTGRMTWFGGPNDPNAQGAPASGLGWRSDGMSYYNTGSLGGRWLIHFPWGSSLAMTQIDLGPNPSTGNLFDLAYSALPSTPYSERTWPNPTVTGTYEGP